MKAAGNHKSGPRVACLPLYPPLELIHSFGFTPAVMWVLGKAYPSTPEADRRLQSFTCSVARKLTEALIAGPGEYAALFFCNACDTLRNLPEILVAGMNESRGAAPPLLRLHVPAADHTGSAAQNLLRDEITGLVSKLESLSGRPFSRDSFRESAALYREMRSLALRAEGLVAEGRLGYADFTAALRECGLLPVEEQVDRLSSLCAGALSHPLPGVPVMLSGILPPPDEVIAFIKDAGLIVAVNDIASQGRSYKTPPPDTDEPAEFYAEYYAHHYPCTTLLHRADARVDELIRAARAAKARGFIFAGEKFCEYEYFEIVHLEKKLKEEGIATLALEFSPEDGGSYQNVKTRVEAFAEVLGK